MSRRIICRGALLCVLFSAGISEETFGQFHVFAGTKAWYATWELRIDRLEGVEQSDYSAALMFGPYLGFSIKKFRMTGYYSRTVLPFEATARNPGLSYMAFNSNRKLSREDINLFFDYRISPEIRLFANYKYLKYTLRDATVLINGSSQSDSTNIEIPGLGGGMMVTVPFRSGSPLYSFMSLGVTLYGNQEEDPAEEEIELLYFLDGGLGYKFGDSPFGMTIGIRMETSKSLKTIVGPTANIFVMF